MTAEGKEVTAEGNRREQGEAELSGRAPGLISGAGTHWDCTTHLPQLENVLSGQEHPQQPSGLWPG